MPPTGAASPLCCKAKELKNWNFIRMLTYRGVLDKEIQTSLSELWCLETQNMDKGKNKVCFGGMVLSDQSIVHLNNMKGKLNNTTNTATYSSQLPNLKPLSSGSPNKTKLNKGGGSNPRFDPTAMFYKLAEARENGKKKKELTLVGFLVGEQKEFPRLFAKLRMEWKHLKGSIIFTILKSGWFEISFSNQYDFQRIWMNHPYHIISQLLLEKHCYPGLDPTTESICQLDLWVSLHLPEEFTNSDALETIIEGIYIRKFLKMDPLHNSERWNMFTIFCINTDVEKTMGKGVIVPDEQFNQLKFSLWLDGFSLECGAYGKSAYVFKDCFNKNAPTNPPYHPKKKPSSKIRSEGEHNMEYPNHEEWKQVGKKNKTIESSPNFSMPSNNFSLSERGGVEILYEFGESDDRI